MNQVIISGNITKDLELKYTTNNNIAVTSFALAVRRRKDETDFINVVAYNKTAELITQYCKKGSKLTVIGRLQVRNYQDKDGKKVYVTEVIVEEVEFGAKKEEPAQEVEPIAGDDLNSELPF